MIKTEKCMAVLKLIDGDQLNLFYQFNRNRETIIDRYKVDLIHALFNYDIVRRKDYVILLSRLSQTFHLNWVIIMFC